MRSAVQIVAERSPGGQTRLVRMHADGMLAVRRTGPVTVHLVGATAGPLGGDEVQIDLRVGPGAVLDLRSVAATIALPHRAGGAARTRLTAAVARGGRLTVTLGSLVVCRGADVRSTTELTLDAEAHVHVVEQVVLGRHGEIGGTWSGRTMADRDGVALLRHTLHSTVAAPSGSGIRGLVSGVTFAPEPRAWGAATAGQAVASPLAAGGLVVTATGTGLAQALHDHDAATSAAAGLDRKDIVS